MDLYNTTKMFFPSCFVPFLIILMILSGSLDSFVSQLVLSTHLGFQKAIHCDYLMPFPEWQELN